MISRLHQKEKVYSMEAIYRELRYSRQGLHQQLRRDNIKSTHDENVLEIVKKWRIKHPRMGSRTLYYTIQNVGGIEMGMGVNKFEQLMSTAGLVIKPLRSSIVKTSDGKGKGQYSNLTNGLVLDNINQLIVGDITYYDVSDNQWSYIFTLKDMYSQRILGLVPSLSLGAAFGCQCLEQAFAQRQGLSLKGCIHHSDNGSQYESKVYKEMLTQAGMVISRADNCLENGSAENLNGIVKNMYLKPWNIRTFKELQKACEELIYINNNERAIEQLGHLSPIQFEQVISELPLTERPKRILYDFDS